MAERAVTKSAFCAARQKLKPSAFIELNRHLVQRWYHDAPIRRWHGLEVRAVDGSTLRLPDTPDAIATFGQMFPAHSAPATLARISQVYDPLNKLILDALIAPITGTSGTFWSSISPLLRRAACCCSIWATRRSGCSPPCRRARSPGVPASHSTPGRWSGVPGRRPGRRGHAGTPHPGSGGLPGPRFATTPIRVRLIRVLLPTGNIEVLMTSLLDPDTYPADAFAELYHLRWAQEECYKCFKSRVEVENWSGKSALTICQDFHAKVLALNLTAVLASTAQEIVDDRCRDDGHPKQVNMTYALCAMKNALVCLLTRANLWSCCVA